MKYLIDYNFILGGFDLIQSLLSLFKIFILFTNYSYFVIMLNGDKMAKDENTSPMELVYDVISDSMEFLFDRVKGDYFTLYGLTVKNILANEILQDDFSDDDKKRLLNIYNRLNGVDISTEDIRKAVQSLMLKGLQESKISNGSITPDTIGMLYAYFISKFEPKEKEIKILDPLAGFGNLLFTLENHLNLKLDLYAVEHNQALVNTMKLNASLMETDINIYFQNTFNSSFDHNMDYIVTDFDYYDLTEEGYFPYNVILHHMDSLKDNGVMMCCVPDDFFNYDAEQGFKKALLEKGSIIGLIDLPDEMFKRDKKSILLIKKGNFDQKKCLLVKLPSFDDPKEFNNSLVKIEMWFEENINNN